MNPQSIKREMSTSMNTVSDSIKRLAISHDGHPQAAPPSTQQSELHLELPSVTNDKPILTVMSNAKDDFISRYEIVREIGKGGFSVVYQCRHRVSQIDYAVKVVDLRPLRLRERFNPTRLKREVEIMRRLKHPNIIQFIEVYEDTDYLMMVLEYCPGTELFDVILSQKCLSEEFARPIFGQVAKALFYLHNLNIIHRDIKPENVLIYKDLNPATGEPIAKLLDFGLSKNAGVGGSAAKTFVGTPCYLAPEVEYTSRGLGTTYGLPADCWSLGAVLYVMLAGQFPSFEKDFAGKVVVKLPSPAWDRVSPAAKDLVRSLMNTNQFARITMANVLKHPWLGHHQMTQAQIEAATMSCYYLGRGLQEEEEQFERQQQQQQMQRAAADGYGQGDQADGEMTAGGVQVYHPQAMVLRANHHNNINNNGDGAPQEQSKGPEQLPIAPLLQLQRSIATCFEEAHEAYREFPEVAAQVRKGAALCREQLTVSTKMLRKVEQTAEAVLGMFPDLGLAIECEEPKLAADFFSMVKDWVVELSELVQTTQSVNKASMDQIQEIVENSTSGLLAASAAAGRKKAATSGGGSTITMPKRILGALMQNLKISGGSGDASPQCPLQIEDCNHVGGKTSSSGANNSNNSNEDDEDESIDLDANQILELFLSLFGVQTQTGGAIAGDGSSNKAKRQNSDGGLNINSSIGVAPHDRVTSIDSDASMEIERRNTASSLDLSSTPNTADGGATQSDFKPIGRRQDRSDTLSSPGPSIGAHSSASYTPHGSGTVDISKLHSDASTVTLNSTGGKAAAQSREGSLEEDDFDETEQRDQQNDRAEHMQHNSMHVFMHNQMKQNTPQKQPMSAQVRAITNGVTYISEALQASTRSGGNSSSNMVGMPSPKAANKLAEALQKLRQVDAILEQLSVFWANTEVVLDLLTKKGRHVEQFLGFASKPKLMARFHERIEEYKRFWEGVAIMSSNYITGVGAAKVSATTGMPIVTSPEGSVTNLSSLSSPDTATPDSRRQQQQQQQQAQANSNMYSFLESERGSSGKSAYYRDTPPSSASKVTEYTSPVASTDARAGLQSGEQRSRGVTADSTFASSFDSTGGIFSYINSLDKADASSSSSSRQQ